MQWSQETSVGGEQHSKVSMEHPEHPVPGSDQLREHRQELGPGCCASTSAPAQQSRGGGLAKGTQGELSPTMSILWQWGKQS